MSESETTLSEYIRSSRQKLGCKQKDVSEAVKTRNISRQYILNLEHNRYPDAAFYSVLAVLQALRELGAPPIDIYSLRIPPSRS